MRGRIRYRLCRSLGFPSAADNIALDTILYRACGARDALDVALALCLKHAALEAVSYLVVEEADSVAHFRRVNLRGERRRVGVCGRSHRPALAVHEEPRVDFVEGRADGVHRLNVMQAHQVETETVDVVFLRPVGNGIDHVLPEHLVLGSGVVAAA